MKLLRLRQVIEKTGMCRATIYNKMLAKEFPRQIKISHRIVAWNEDEIDEWIRSKITPAPHTTKAASGRRQG